MNNQLIEVTPPDILALDDGISVLVLGDAKWLTDLKDFVNKTFIHSPVALYYTDKRIRSDTIHWAVYQNRMADYAIVDLETANELELMLALTRDRATFYVCNPNSQKDKRRILHAREQEVMVFDSVEQLKTYFQNIVFNQPE
jgi:hypothetical protein|tara:strand:- start:1521 stop:1946 length:426 start_codon:yes stop_codon:yes gene_type:complete